MSDSDVSSTSPMRRHLSAWSDLFSTHQSLPDDTEAGHLNVDLSEGGCDAFIHAGEDILSPPCFNSKPLDLFLQRAHLGDLTTSKTLVELSRLCLIDARSSVNIRSRALCSSQAKLQLPSDERRNINGSEPEFETRVFREIQNERDLYQKLVEKDSNNYHNRSVFYIETLTPLCAIALATTISRRFACNFKAFLQSYLLGEIYFFAKTHKISFHNINPAANSSHENSRTSLTFSMGFHLSYVTLRDGPAKCDSRGVRQSYSMIKAIKNNTDELFYYDAQISFLITGVDEGNWTAYCIADTYPGKGQDARAYFTRGVDGPSGGARAESQPCWNPREYFLLVLSQRIAQTAREWENAISILMERLDAYESYYIRTIDSGNLCDNAEMSQTRSYMKAISILRQLHDTLSTQCDSLKTFLDDNLSYFETDDKELEERWNGYFDRIESESVNLRRWQRRLMQRMQRFDSMKEGLMSSSALLESRKSTKQGNDIGVLTNMTVAYLPVNLAAGVFSISSNAPHGLVWVYWTVTSLVLGIITFYFAFWRRVKRRFF